MSEDEVRRNLAILQAGDFLHELRLFPSMEYTFRHTLTQEVAHDTVLRERRRTLHAQVMEALEQLEADRPGDQVESLAHHALRGEVWHKAVLYLRQAGAKAAARGANREAVGFLEQALAACPISRTARSDPSRPSICGSTCGRRCSRWDRSSACWRSRRRPRRSREKLGDAPRLARVYSYLVNYHYLKGEPDLAIEYGERCLRLGEAAAGPLTPGAGTRLPGLQLSCPGKIPGGRARPAPEPRRARRDAGRRRDHPESHLVRDVGGVGGVHLRGPGRVRRRDRLPRPGGRSRQGQRASLSAGDRADAGRPRSSPARGARGGSPAPRAERRRLS